MDNEQKSWTDPEGLSGVLEQRRSLLEEALANERDMVEQSFSEMAERTQWWEGLMTDLRRAAWSSQLSSYGSLARSMGGLLGGSVKEQAKIMIPFEIAEATREFARFLGTRDPGALASSLKHALAARQYAAAAKAGASGAAGGGASFGGGAAPAAAPQQPEEHAARARVIVNVGRQVGVVDTYEFARTLIEAINENLKDDVVLEVAS